MKLRTKPLVLPDPLPARYWTVDLARGTYTFKNPYYGIGNAVIACLGRHTRDPKTDDRPVDEQGLALVPLAGLVVGLCWAHPTLELETPTPKLEGLTDEVLLAYGEAVSEELQDVDFDMLLLLDMFGAITPQLHKRQSMLLMALERSSFSGALQEDSTAS